METLKLQSIKKILIEYQNLKAQYRRTGNAIYEQMADRMWNENNMNKLEEPSENTFGGKIYKEFSTTKMYFAISEIQAFWVALEFCAENNIDMDLVKKYKKN